MTSIKYRVVFILAQLVPSHSCGGQVVPAHCLEQLRWYTLVGIPYTSCLRTASSSCAGILRSVYRTRCACALPRAAPGVTSPTTTAARRWRSRAPTWRRSAFRSPRAASRTYRGRTLPRPSHTTAAPAAGQAQWWRSAARHPLARPLLRGLPAMLCHTVL